ncbi:MAG: hypothetical protein MUE50_24210 [Pirellulaceae bacterium]|jgi:hypothetical protein|nr:hypothetical protein [Pirellulaceae bacterium]
MLINRLALLSPAVIAAVIIAVVSPLHADEELQKRATWQPPSVAEVTATVDQWLAGQKLDDPTKAKIAALWAEDQLPAVSADVLDRLAETIALADPAARDLVAMCRGGQPSPVPTAFDILLDDTKPPLVRNNLRLLFGRWLAQHALYDEALDQLNALQPDQVIDPAGLLFYQGVCHHRLLQKEPCLTALSRLMENKGRIPKRYELLAGLMEADLKPLKTDSLDEVSRMMDDIERRLGLGRAGKRVRTQEDDVIAKLDKMIEEMEKQAQQQQASSSAQGGKQPAKPMEDSQPGGGSGPGEVDQRRPGVRSDWGNLPPKQREEAMQQISKGLPSHYRDVIEEYFRKMAREGGN